MKKSSLIIGRQPLIEALENGRGVDKIFMYKNINGDNVQVIRQLARAHNVPLQMVPAEKLNSFTRANHQGVIAIAALVQYTDLQQVIDHDALCSEPEMDQPQLLRSNPKTAEARGGLAV